MSLSPLGEIVDQALNHIAGEVRASIRSLGTTGEWGYFHQPAPPAAKEGNQTFMGSKTWPC